MSYLDNVLDHYENPGNVDAPAYGDVMRLQIEVEVEEENNTIKDAKFKTFGCGSTIASRSYIAEWVIGKKLSLSSSQNSLLCFGGRCN